MLAQRSKLARIVPSPIGPSKPRKLLAGTPPRDVPAFRKSSERQQRGKYREKKRGEGRNFPVLRERLIANQRSIGSRARGKSRSLHPRSSPRKNSPLALPPDRRFTASRLPLPRRPSQPRFDCTNKTSRYISVRRSLAPFICIKRETPRSRSPVRARE